MRCLFFLAASVSAFSTNALPASPRIRASSTQMAFVADVADALPLPTEVTNAAQTLSPYVSSGVEKLSGALEMTPVANYFDNPLYEPAASLVVLYAGYTVAGFVLQVIVQIVLFPLLESSAGRDFLNPDKYVVGKRLGGGSYGTVYEAYKTSGAAVEVASEPTCVIKTAKTSQQAAEFALAELFINQKLMLCGQGNCMARFQGHFYDGGSLSLVYQNEGKLTLAKAIQAGDFPFNVERQLMGKGGFGEIGGDDEALFKRKAAVIRKIASQLFGNLAGIHSWNVVHRDVKGENLILSERERRFKV